MRKKLLIAVGMFLLVGTAIFYYWLKPSEMKKFAKINPENLVVKIERGVIDRSKPSYCPMPGDLEKQGDYWQSKNREWISYTPSLANKISKFSGAQWIGVGVGKIICLYLTNEEVSFPLAIEQKYEQLIVEPVNGEGGWSTLVENRYRMCKSASAADCFFFVEAPKKVDDVYSEIQYKRK